MSALGQKQTFAVQKGVSALPPKADIQASSINVRFVPIADIRHISALVKTERPPRSGLSEKFHHAY
jgi:hypothetical protein